MLRRLSLRDFVLVESLEIEFGAGFAVLTGETGAGKSILIDALQFVLGDRADGSRVREGANRAEVVAEFDPDAAISAWADEAGFDPSDGLLLKRAVDAQGKSRAWICGSPATATQLREAGEHLVEIHGQHAWQRLAKPAAVREWLDGQAGVDGAAMAAAFARRQAAQGALERARGDRERIVEERERLSWQLAEIDRLAPRTGEWDELNAEQQRLAHARGLIEGAAGALVAVSEDETGATAGLGRAIHALETVAGFDASLVPVLEVLRSAQAQIGDAVHSLGGYLAQTEVDPQRLEAVDSRLSAWIAIARRNRQDPAELPALAERWRVELAALEAGLDLGRLESEFESADRAWRAEAERAHAARAATAGPSGEQISRMMQSLGMAGGRFEIALIPLDQPQAGGLEAVEFRVAGHAGASPRALAKVASGGELSRLALAIAIVGSTGGAPTLIFDEIDSGVGGAVGDAVGKLMKRLGRERQVLAVTHLAQVAACADRHFEVSKTQRAGRPLSSVSPVEGARRVAEIARMLGGEALTGTRVAHAEAMLRELADDDR